MTKPTNFTQAFFASMTGQPGQGASKTAQLQSELTAIVTRAKTGQQQAGTQRQIAQAPALTGK